MSEPLNEVFQFLGKACGTIVKDLADISQPLTEAFRRGWREAMTEQPQTESTPSSSNHAPESA